nr:hypothetical protein [Tanacetum cinerariifolium]
TINLQETQQVIARDEKWVPSTERVKISPINVRLLTTMHQKEETFQVVIDVIKKSTCFKAFTISAKVPEYLCSISGTLSRSKRTKSVVIYDTPSVPKPKPAASKLKLKGVQSLTPKEQEVTNSMQTLKESRKTSRRQPSTGGSNKKKDNDGDDDDEDEDDDHVNGCQDNDDEDTEIESDEDEIYKCKIQVHKDVDLEMEGAKTVERENKEKD